MRLLPAFLVWLFVAGFAAPAHACSWGWKKGWSPDEIKERTDVRRVIGTFSVVELRGTPFIWPDGEKWIADPVYIGRIETGRGTSWDTRHSGPDMSSTCYIGTYLKPTANASGTFWISRKKVDGRYQILLWEGDYLPARGDARQSESDAS